MPDELAVFDARAKREHLTRSALARKLILCAMTADGEEPTQPSAQRHATSIEGD
ncbi:hypothetical ribbon-helix-helix domain harboring protein [Ralstonia pseudosolanacearum GMI1000]|uniref:Hypothetical ribbon-helix-helix domain harboring protein n=1 Tax=Ralstonia nicotianae (strain ATCC BAA-1114 / GMI1000) TaxID=267608 RepID=Q8XY57_RALN1|nr:hypothetical ribbon-helix-helix domain harboring protein [Ralstonia pseudosolanacearum GMI1000]